MSLPDGLQKATEPAFRGRVLEELRRLELLIEGAEPQQTDSGPSIETLTDLTDVTITSPSTDQVLKYDGIGWINGSLPTSAINDLTDVSISGATTGQVLQYNGSTWNNSALTVGEIGNVVLTSESSGDVLEYNGTNWVNVELRLSALSDVFLSPPFASDDAVMAWDRGNSRMVITGTPQGTYFRAFSGSDATTYRSNAIVPTGTSFDIDWCTIADGSTKGGFEVDSNGNIGFFGGTPGGRTSVTGSTGGNVALQNLLTALNNLNLIEDLTT